MNDNWTPKIGGKYWVYYASSQCRGISRRIFLNSALDESYRKTGNFFKRKADASFVLKMLGKGA